MMSTTDKLSHLISLAGGLSDIGGIECLSDLESGKLLLDWLASQLDSVEPDEEDADDEERDRRLFASARDLILEKEEVLLLNHIKSLDGIDKSNEHLDPHSDYVPPSRLQKHAEYIDNETDLVQREGDMLRTRIAQTKDACKKLTHSIKLLQHAVFNLDSQVRGSEERLSELSISADITITSTLNIAEDTLRDLGFSDGKEHQHQSIIHEHAEGGSDLASARALLLKNQNELSRITISLRKNLEDFASLREQEITRIEDLQAEVNRLQMTFTLKRGSNDCKKTPKTERLSAQGSQSIPTKELKDICITLERELALKEAGDMSTDDALDVLLSELDGIHLDPLVHEKEVPILEMVETAWALDQEAILNMHEEILDEALSSYELRIAPLERLRVFLSVLACCVQDAEATLEALGEELGEICLPNDTGKSKTNNRKADQGEELEQRLKLALNEFKDLRQADPSPMVLLTSDDILSGLRALKGRPAILETSERSWADNLVHKFSARPLNAALTKIYSNSPLNTTTPFAYPADFRELEAQTRAKTTELQNLASSLEEEAREALAKHSYLKRLTNFVEKCADIQPRG